MRFYVLTGITRGSTRRKAIAVLASAALLLPFTGHASAVSVPTRDDFSSAYAASAYIRFTEVGVGTKLQNQYASLGFHFSGGTVEAHGSSAWLAPHSKSLTISLRDTLSSEPLASSALSFDIDSAKGGGQFQVQGFDRNGNPVLNSIVIGGTRAMLHAPAISSLKISTLSKVQNWGISQLRSGSDVAPSSNGGTFELCYTESEGQNGYTMTVTDPPEGPVSITADSSGCASLQVSGGNAVLTALQADYNPPSTKCATFNGAPVEFFLKGFYIPVFFGPETSGGPLAIFKISEDGSTGCSTLDFIGGALNVTDEAGAVLLSQ